jgi:hypothetical protein
MRKPVRFFSGIIDGAAPACARVARVTPELDKGRSRSVGLIALALLLVAAASLLAWRIGLRGDRVEAEVAAPATPAPAEVAAAGSSPAAPSAPARPPAFTVQRRQPAPAAPPPPASTEAPRAEPPPLPEFPDGPVGGPSGIAVFPPPGTDPPKTGIVVPEDFELPEGYVRHYQATDDGELLSPILMFHPDYEFFDANGQPIELPEDLIVPPELAPPGLENEPLLEVPPPALDEPENPVP